MLWLSSVSRVPDRWINRHFLTASLLDVRDYWNEAPRVKVRSALVSSVVHPRLYIELMSDPELVLVNPFVRYDSPWV